MRVPKRFLSSAEGVSYAEVFKNLKKKVKPDELGVTIKGVWETRNGGVLIKVGKTAEG